MALASFVLFAYNQEQFIREAVEGALAQTYSPLEIILSDDCSSDRTFAVMQETVASYHGPHKIRLNRNETNLGIIAHYNKVCQLATGQLLVFAAGDDLSLPRRTQRIMDEWKERGRPREAVFYSRVQRITQEGAAYPREGAWFGHRQSADPAKLISEWGGFVIGATVAVTRGLLERFGPILSNMPCEDIPTLWRGALCGSLHFVDEALVRWRVGGGGLWSSVYDRPDAQGRRLEHMRRFLCERQALAAQARLDIDVAGATSELMLSLGRFEEETACALASLTGSAWLFLYRYLRLWARNGQVSHALRECVVEYIRISNGLGRCRFLWLITESAAYVFADRRKQSPQRPCTNAIMND